MQPHSSLVGLTNIIINVGSSIESTSESESQVASADERGPRRGSSTTITINTGSANIRVNAGSDVQDVAPASGNPAANGSPESRTTCADLEHPINTASKNELMGIPLIKDDYATKGMKARPIKSWAQVNEIHGIGPERMKTLKKWFPQDFLASGYSSVHENGVCVTE